MMRTCTAWLSAIEAAPELWLLEKILNGPGLLSED